MPSVFHVKRDRIVQNLWPASYPLLTKRVGQAKPPPPSISQLPSPRPNTTSCSSTLTRKAIPPPASASLNPMTAPPSTMFCCAKPIWKTPSSKPSSPACALSPPTRTLSQLPSTSSRPTNANAASTALCALHETNTITSSSIAHPPSISSP